MLEARILHSRRDSVLPCSHAIPNSPSASLSQNPFFHFHIFCWDGPQMTCFGISRAEFALLPSVLGFFISSTLMSFFLTLRVEFTSLCNLLNFTDSSVSSSDCSLDWQRNKGKVNQIIAGRSSASLPVWTLAPPQLNLGHQQSRPTGS